MSWLYLSIVSALLLGFYDLAKKRALDGNAVLPVLFFSVVTGALAWAGLLVWGRLAPAAFPFEALRVAPLQLHEHGLLVLKSALVASSWLFGYFALKHLPLSVAGPVRSTSPLWTVILAVMFMGERPSALQWTGVAVILAAFYAFSFVGKAEGIHFHRDKWIVCMLAAAVLAAVSGIYDKFLLQRAAIPPAAVQAWFSIYLVGVMLPFQLFWQARAWPRGSFRWRWSIPLIGLFLLASDFLYFTAVGRDGALISVISPIRRAAVIVTFFGGIFVHKEPNFRPKLACVLALLAGIVLLNSESG